MKIEVDMGRCEYHGQCVFIAPAEFRFEDDELVHVEEAPEEARERVVKAARACPQLAIKIVD